VKKVMLVDDEIVIRENIRDSIDWEREGFVYCSDASDGELALPIIESVKPDILITDIKMPFCNGLELSAIVRKKLPDTKIIILSGHDEFEYARSALRLGIEEYCLKPVSAAGLIGILKNVSAKIDAEREEKERLATLHRAGQNRLELTRERLLADICTGMITTAEAMDAAASLGLNLAARCYLVFITDVRSADRRDEPDSSVLEQAELIIRERLSGIAQMYDYKRSRTERVWIARHDAPDVLERVAASIQQDLKAELEAVAEHSLGLGVGSVRERLQGVHASFLDADEDKHWRRLAISARSRWSLQQGEMSLESTTNQERQKYIEFLKVGTPAELDSIIEMFGQGLRKNDWRSHLYGYYALSDLTIEVFQTAKRIYRNLDDAGAVLQQFQQAIGEIACWKDAVSYLTRLSEQFWQWRSGAADRYAQMLEQARDYIQRHYAEDRLSLQDVADHVCVSASHLSKVFSQETGQTFIEFLTSTRIRRAMELLQTTNDRSYEIAHRVGYNDAHYFSNLFKKVTGMTTKEFRKQGRLDTGVAAKEGVSG